MPSTKSSSTEIALELIQLISKPSFRRSDREVENVLPWLRKRSQLLQNQEIYVLVDLVKNCSIIKTSPDDVIIKQGERGDSYYEDFNFYIILRGSVSVYIDPKMTGESGGDDASSKSGGRKKEKQKKPPQKVQPEDSVLSGMEKSEEESEAPPEPEVVPDLEEGGEEAEAEDEDGETGKKQLKKQKPLVPLDRNKMGKYICSYGPGKAFGELALVNHDSLRNATIITDENTELMVVDQDLFDRSLRSDQEAKYAEIRAFIEEHPFFNQMNTKFKKLLEMSLRKEHYVFDTHIMKQGEPLIGLHFITSGAANIIIQPKKHQHQYSHMWPFEAGVDQLSIEFEHLRELRRQAILRKYEDPSVWETKPEELVIRREQGYAAIEKKMKENHINLCSVQAREVLGDVETLVGLSTYMQTVRCTANTTCFVLDTKNFERLVSKKNNPQTMDVMREYVKSKLHTRMNMRNADLIPLLGYLHQKLTEQSLPPAKKPEPFKTSKKLPDIDEEVQHLLQYFRDGKEVVLIKPSVPGVVYYRELMREKAKTREAQRKAAAKGDIKIGINKNRRQRRQPRSMLQIRESLRQMMEAEVIELESKKVKKKGKQKTEKLGSNYTSMSSLDSARQMAQQMPNETKSDKNAKTSLMKMKPNGELVDSIDGSLKAKDNLPKATPPVFVTEVSQNKTDINLPAIREEKTQEELLLRGQQSPIVNKPETPRTSVQNTHDIKSETNQNQIAQEHVVAVHTEPDRPPDLVTPKRNKQQQNATDTNKDKLPSLGLGKDIDKNVGGGQITDRTESDSKSTLSSNWQTAMTFVNKRVQERLAQRIMEEETSYKDYETSEPSLNLLENRIKAFHVQYGMGNKTKSLPHLKRFKLDDDLKERPRPGGKVWVRRQPCKFSNTEFRVKDHKHERYQMVDSIPEFTKVQKSKIVMQQILKTANFGENEMF